jgi:hypothetical protein
VRALALAIGLAGLCALPAQAAPSPAFAAFQSLCMGHRGDPPGALAAATTAGWQPVPKAVLGMIPLSSGKITGLDGRLLSGGGGLMVLLVGHSDELAKGRPIPAEVCALGVTGDTATLKAEVETLAGVPAQTDPEMKTGAVYVWRAEGDRHVPVALASLRPDQPQHDVSMVALASQGPVTMVALTVPTK